MRKTRTNLYRPPESWSVETCLLYRQYEANLWRELARPRVHLVLLRPYFQFQVRHGFAFHEIDRPALDFYLATFASWKRRKFLSALSRWLRFLKKMGQPLIPKEPELPGDSVHRLKRVDRYPELKPPESWPPRAVELYRQYQEKLQRRILEPKIYLLPLQHFFRAQSEQGCGFRDFPLALLEGYFATLRPHALRGLLSALGSWLRFLYRRRELLLPLHKNLAEYRPRVKSRRTVLSHDQVLQLISLTRAQTTPEYLRDRAFLEMAYASAMRPGELLALNLPELTAKAR